MLLETSANCIQNILQTTGFSIIFEIYPQGFGHGYQLFQATFASAIGDESIHDHNQG